MTGQPPFDLDFGGMPDTGWVYDFVTTPSPTTLLSVASARGMATVGGIDMLIEQAADSFNLLFAAEAPRDKDGELRQKLAS